jgi:NO-binding membrane sensor protein with MHYT domain
MTRTEIIAVAIRLLAIYFFVQALSLLVVAVAAPVKTRAWGDAAMFLVQLALLLVACALTWRLAPLLAGKVLPEIDPGESVLALSTRDLERVALRVLGAFLVVVGVSGLGYSAMYASVVAKARGEGTWLDQLGGADVAGGAVRSLIQVVAGVGLFLGMSGLRRVTSAMRGAGADVEQAGEDEAEPGSGKPAT